MHILLDSLCELPPFKTLRGKAAVNLAKLLRSTPVAISQCNQTSLTSGNRRMAARLSSVVRCVYCRETAALSCPTVQFRMLANISGLQWACYDFTAPML